MLSNTDGCAKETGRDKRYSLECGRETTNARFSTMVVESERTIEYTIYRLFLLVAFSMGLGTARRGAGWFSAGWARQFFFDYILWSMVCCVRVCAVHV